MARERSHPPVAPLILTAALDAATTARFDAERERHFPPERNFLRAHLTLFHALPGDGVAAVLSAARAAVPAAPMPAVVARLLKLGRGVAYGIDCPPLLELRSAIAAAGFDLTRQDQAWGRAHVTIQNKVEPAEAAALYDQLSASFEPWPASIRGLTLHRYAGGPWTHVADVPFGQ